MTSNFIIALAELLRECPKCHKTSIGGASNLSFSSSEVSRSCECGYKISLIIKEGTNEPEKKILNEGVKTNGNNN